MNTHQIGLKFEKEALIILNQLFDEVVWLSKKNRLSSFDFLCKKDGKNYYVDAKVGNYPSITKAQKEVDFLIVKRINGIEIWGRDIIQNMKPSNEGDITTIKLKQSTRKRLQKLKKYPRETNEDTLIRLIKKEIENNAVSDQLKIQGELQTDSKVDASNSNNKKEVKTR